MNFDIYMYIYIFKLNCIYNCLLLVFMLIQLKNILCNSLQLKYQYAILQE